MERVRFNRLSEWSPVLHQWTAPGESVLELGSGTGETSLQLSQAGRKVTVLDIEPQNLEFAARCAEDLGIPLRTVQGDATRPLPFADQEFNCIWQCGLLEHFTFPERHEMLKEWMRVASSRLIALVPNAACLAYRVGKTRQEERGTWAKGLEMPLLTLRPDFEAVGLKVIAEYSVGVRHALSFLDPGDPLRQELHSWFTTAPRDVVEQCNQGYLLVTVGEK